MADNNLNIKVRLDAAKHSLTRACEELYTAADDYEKLAKQLRDRADELNELQ